MSDHICNICLEPLIIDITFTPCIHGFHTECIQEWIKVSGNTANYRSICPVCHLDISEIIAGLYDMREILIDYEQTSSRDEVYNTLCDYAEHGYEDYYIVNELYSENKIQADDTREIAIQIVNSLPPDKCIYLRRELNSIYNAIVSDSPYGPDDIIPSNLYRATIIDADALRLHNIILFNEQLNHLKTASLTDTTFEDRESILDKFIMTMSLFNTTDYA